MRHRLARPFLLMMVLLLAAPGVAAAQQYRIERVASGLNQPTYVTQAPGDAANILYFTERTQNANPGFGVANNMGKVYRYDVTTRIRDLVLDLSSRPVRDDAGLQTIAFHPDFQTNGKLYVSSAEDNTGVAPTSRVEEYIITNTGTAVGYTAALSRTVLQYNGIALSGNHTVNWIGFDPTATGAARDYLYISTGDGNAGAANRPSQDPNDIRGKMLRVDVAGGDSYPGDANKNFAVPPTNPLPVYNQTHPPIAGLGEVYMTGLRNVYRAGFDRATGDLYFGDVGEQTREEINFLKAGSNGSGPPADFGWPQREGTANGWTAPFAMTNPHTGVTSRNPIQEMPHPNALAFIGGYRYRGPVAELADNYFFADFATDKLYMLEDFNPETDPASFNGANGTRTDITALWNSLVMDPTDPTYAGTNTNTNLFGIDHIVSLGEDNTGNLYIVDFGYGTGFQGQYPGPGLGEIFRVTLIPEPATAALLAPLSLLMLRRRPRTCAFIVALLLSLATQGRASADVVQLTASKDNTLYENATGSLSNGAGPTLYAGKTGPNDALLLRRAVVAFDLSPIPPGSTVDSASLTVQLTKAPGGAGSIAENFALSALLGDWGQGTSNAGSPGGAGTASTTGDATWVHRFHNTSAWTTPGGDFSAAVSASQILAGPGSYTFSSAQLAADVQAWLNDPAGNFGWILRGDETLVDGTLGAKEFASREHATVSYRPTLTVTYSIPEPAVLAPVAIAALTLVRRRFSRPALRSVSPTAPVSG